MGFLAFTLIVRAILNTIEAKRFDIIAMRAHIHIFITFNVYSNHGYKILNLFPKSL